MNKYTDNESCYDDLELSDRECLLVLENLEKKTLTKGQTGTDNTQNLVKHYIDEEALKTWVIVGNKKARDYQVNIIFECFKKNTLVVLPTGLGKTLIAVIVMYNFSRWFPNSKIMFVTPTRPLVEQQMKSYISTTMSSVERCATLTGTLSPERRQPIWDNHSIFFLTPQILHNDIESEKLDARTISLVVFDEAHHAVGETHYAKIVRMMVQKGCNFRLLGLSATPGSSFENTQEIVNNLLVEHISMRTEKSQDVEPYTFRKHLIKENVDPSDLIVMYMEKIDSILNSYYDSLRVYEEFRNKKDPKLMSRFAFVTMMANYGTHKKSKTVASTGKNRFKFDNDISTWFLVCHPEAYSVVHSISRLLHSKELLETYGLAQCLDSLKNIECTAPQNISNSDLNKFPKSLKYDSRLPLLINDIELNLKKMPLEHTYHPKINRLPKILLDFFSDETCDNKTSYNFSKKSRALIFTNYLISVNEIYNALSNNHPDILPSTFIGKSSKYRQKDQLRTLQDFKDGIYNVLICTSVAEEGLDIAEVDMVIFYDLHKSLIRLIQRMGRTSRNREGKVVFLLCGKRENSTYNQCMSKIKSAYSSLEKNKKNNKLTMCTSSFSCLKIPFDYGCPKRVLLSTMVPNILKLSKFDYSTALQEFSSSNESDYQSNSPPHHKSPVIDNSYILTPPITVSSTINNNIDSAPLLKNQYSPIPKIDHSHYKASISNIRSASLNNHTSLPPHHTSPLQKCITKINPKLLSFFYTRKRPSSPLFRSSSFPKSPQKSPHLDTQNVQNPFDPL